MNDGQGLISDAASNLRARVEEALDYGGEFINTKERDDLADVLMGFINAELTPLRDDRDRLRKAIEKIMDLADPAHVGSRANLLNLVHDITLRTLRG